MLTRIYNSLFYKDFFTGLAVFLVPVTIFIKPLNLRQLVIFDLYIILISLIVVFLTIVIFSICLNFFIKKTLKKRPHSIFSLCCVGFYLLFFFTPLRSFIKTIFSMGGAAILSVILLFLIWLAICIAVLFSKKIDLIFRKSLIIFACIIISFSLIFNVLYLSEFWEIELDTETKTKQELFNTDKVNIAIKKNKLHNYNIYYIILDAMVALEYAAKLDIIDEVKTIASLQKAGLNYINQSYSSYNTTYLTLASIMEIDHPVTDQSAKYNNRGDFFPGIMHQDEKPVLLPEFISKIGNDFFWLGSETEGMSLWCQEWANQPWICIDNSKTMTILRRLSRTIYYNTPLSFIIKIKFIFPNKQIDPQRTMKLYINYSKKNIDSNGSKFVFIHQMSPHGPYLVSEHCKPKQHAVKFEGYRASYNCVLKEVLDFMKYINTFDPKSIVVFQGDHGINDEDLLKKYKTSEEKLFFKAGIFNALKAPKECFEKFRKPSTSVNTIRFVLNCAYELNLPFFETIHYEGFYEAHPEYGKVFAHIF